MVERSKVTECGTCGFVWDDSVITDRTPAPSARTPCEYWHVFDENYRFIGVDVPADDRGFIETVRGSFRDYSDPVRFFFEHAGFSYNPAKGETPRDGAIRNAKSLAKAESEAKRRGWWITAETDPEGPMEDDAGSVEYVESGEGVCLNVDLWRDSGGVGLIRDDELLQSLGNVIVPDSSDPYIRVVGAELANEQLAQEGWFDGD